MSDNTDVDAYRAAQLIYPVAAVAGGHPFEVIDKAFRLLDAQTDFAEAAGWLNTEWASDRKRFVVHVAKVIAVNDGSEGNTGQPGVRVLEVADDEGNQRESYLKVGSTQNAVFRKVLVDAKKYMASGEPCVLHCGYEPNVAGRYRSEPWTEIKDGQKVTPNLFKRVFWIAPARGARPQTQAAPQAPAAPTEPQPAPAAAPVAAPAAPVAPGAGAPAPTAAPAPVADSIADLEAQLAAARAAQQGAQEAPAVQPVAATSSSDAALPTDEEWQQLYSKKLKMAQRRELNQRATAEGWEGHNPGAANMLKAFAAICEYLTEEEIASVLSPAAAA